MKILKLNVSRPTTTTDGGYSILRDIHNWTYDITQIQELFHLAIWQRVSQQTDQNKFYQITLYDHF